MEEGLFFMPEIAEVRAAKTGQMKRPPLIRKDHKR
jgi:hypothetical protein